MKYLQLFKNNQPLLGSDGVMTVDGRFNKDSIHHAVRQRNNRFAVNFPHKVADQYAIYKERIGSTLGSINNI